MVHCPWGLVPPRQGLRVALCCRQVGTLKGAIVRLPLGNGSLKCSLHLCHSGPSVYVLTMPLLKWPTAKLPKSTGQLFSLPLLGCLVPLPRWMISGVCLHMTQRSSLSYVHPLQNPRPIIPLPQTFMFLYDFPVFTLQGPWPDSSNPFTPAHEPIYILTLGHFSLSTKWLSQAPCKAYQLIRFSLTTTI